VHGNIKPHTIVVKTSFHKVLFLPFLLPMSRRFPNPRLCLDFFFFSLSLTLIFFVFFFSLIPSLICRSAVFKSRSLGMQEDSPFRRRKTRQPQGTTGPQSDFSVGAMWISRRTCGRSGACWRNYWRGRCNSAGLGCQTSFGPSLCFLGSPRTRL